MAAVWVFIGVMLAGLGASVAFWPWIVANDLAGDVIRAGSLSVPILGAICLWWLRKRDDRKLEMERRDRRMHRILVALRAEIVMQMDQHLAQFGAGRIERIFRAHLQAVEDANKGEQSMPVGVVQNENDVFDNIKPELADLPDAVIGPIIAYYQNDEYVIETIKAFSAGAFEKKSKARRKKVLLGYFNLGRDATLAGFAALEELDRQLDAMIPSLTGEMRIAQSALADYDTKRLRMLVAEEGLVLAPGNSDDDDGGAIH